MINTTMFIVVGLSLLTNVIGCSSLSWSRVEFTSSPGICYIDQKDRAADWAVSDRELVILVRPLTPNGLFCEPYPRLERFATIGVVAQLIDGVWQGRALVSIANDEDVYRVANVQLSSCSYVGVVIYAVDDTSNATLKITIRGKPTVSLHDLHVQISGLFKSARAQGNAGARGLPERDRGRVNKGDAAQFEVNKGDAR